MTSLQAFKNSEKIKKLEQRIEADKYDAEAWSQLFQEASKSLKIGDGRDYYERCLFETWISF
eukprot:m.166535 g.166535  ORF g.166535 m.166535 type:complete len:62 (-) comp15281_c0_seq3:3298-3483(-)